MTKYKALVFDKESKTLLIVEISQTTKKKAIKDLRNNGYRVNEIKVKKEEVFDYIMNNTNCYPWDWEIN